MVYLRLLVQTYIAEHLHANDGVDEEDHDDQQANVWQGFDRLHKRPQQNSNRLSLAQELYLGFELLVSQNYWGRIDKIMIIWNSHKNSRTKS